MERQKYMPVTTEDQKLVSRYGNQNDDKVDTCKKKRQNRDV